MLNRQVNGPSDEEFRKNQFMIGIDPTETFVDKCSIMLRCLVCVSAYKRPASSTNFNLAVCSTNAQAYHGNFSRIFVSPA